MARRRQANLEYRKNARRMRALGRLEHNIARVRELIPEVGAQLLVRLDAEAARLAAVIAAHRDMTS